MENECAKWLLECRKAFPNLAEYEMLSEYATISNDTLSVVSGSAKITRDVDPEAILLGGDTSATITREQSKEFQIKVNKNLRKIRNPALRKQVVQHSIIHDLLRIESKELVTVIKEGERRRSKRLPKKEFDKRLLQKFNEVRAASGLPQISSMANIDAAIGKILSEIKFE